MSQELGNGWAENVHPEDFDRCVNLYRTAFDARRPFSMTYRLKRHDGAYRELLDNGAAFYRSGEFAGYFGSCIDVTDLHALESQLRQTQKMDAIGQLTGGVAHDFNNLLTVILGSVELLKRPNLPEDRRKTYIDAIGDAADRGAKLTAQLLAFSRPQSLKRETFDIVESIDKVAIIVRSLTGSRIELRVESPEGPLLVDTDRSQFDTAIVNMAINARDAMKGEGKLVIRSAAADLLPTRRGHEAITGDFVAVTIADTGQGITADNLKRVFEPFFTTKAVGQGTGLGLSQVIGFAKQSGGDIVVESEIDCGSSFTLYLPRTHGSATPPMDADIASEGRCRDGEGICVLVVEDNASVGDFAVGALRELGYDSVLATNGEQAMAELAKNCGRFHVVFSDVVMPGIGGVELGQFIRREHPHIPVILTSGYSHILAQNKDHGFELLHKPYSIEELSRVLSTTIRGLRARAPENG